MKKSNYFKLGAWVNIEISIDKITLAFFYHINVQGIASCGTMQLQ